MRFFSKRNFFIQLLFIGVFAFIGFTSAKTYAKAGVSEYDLKAVLLVKLVRFVYLPNFDEDSTQLNICLAGANPFGKTLEKLAQKPLDGLKINLIQLSQQNLEQNSAICHFGFINPATPAELNFWLENFATTNTLTISDLESFAQKGGMIELALPEKSSSSISILINRKVAEDQGIKFNSQLLRLAKLVS